MTNISQLDAAFTRVGWFLAPYIQFQALSKLASEILARGNSYTQDNLEQGLMLFYGPGALAPMVMHRYTIVPVIKEYRETIAEAIEAHFLGLNHVAVSGLLPVIEGAGRHLANIRCLSKVGHINDVFAQLAESCKKESLARNMGEPNEIASMMDSFLRFTKQYMYISSDSYPLNDNTNRHGILHGTFADNDYGRPLNFYKIIAAIDFLTLVASFRTHVSWLAPSQTGDSQRLTKYYMTLLSVRRTRVR